MSDELNESDRQFEELCNMLEISEEMSRTLEEFSKIKDNNQKVLFVENLQKNHKLIPDFKQWKQKKDPVKSKLYHDEGNKCFRENKFLDAFEWFNKSLCYAPPGSAIVGLTYADRSAVYLAMKYYEKAEQNIELARNHHYPKNELKKLTEQEEKCLELMNNKPQKDRFQENQKILDKILETNIPGNKRAPCYIAECLELKTSPEFGRYIVTNKDLEVGTVIAIEEVFLKGIYPSVRYERCSNCLKKNFLHLIPCDSCCSAMFCSEECKVVAWEKFHQFECEVIDALEKISCENSANVIRIFLEYLHFFNGDPVALSDFLKSIENSRATVFDFDFSKMSEIEKKKSLLQAVDGFECHENKRDQRQLLAVSNFAAILCNLFLNHTKLGSILNNEDSRSMFRKYILKQATICIVNLHALGEASTKTFQEPNFSDIGPGCFPFCSLLSHSCAPNVKRISVRSKNHLFVYRPIKAGEQIIDCYGYNHFDHDLEDRQWILQMKYLFTCRCVACEMPKNFPLCKEWSELTPHDQSLPHFDELIHTRKDLNGVHEKYESNCRYLQQNDRKLYPSSEIRASQIWAFLKCMKVFFMSDEH